MQSIEKISKMTIRKLIFFLVAGAILNYGVTNLDLEKDLQDKILKAVYVAIAIVATNEIAHFISGVISKQGIPNLERIIKIVIWAIAVLLILSNLNINISSLLAGLGLSGLAIALGAQETLGNLFASISILTDKPFVVGDRIKIDTHTGRVLSIGMRSTRIETISRTIIIVPNKTMASSMIENLSLKNE